VVTVDNPMIIPLVVEDEDTQVEVQLTNHGLIAAEQVHLDLPNDPNYDFIPLIKVIDSFPAMSSMSIPVIVRHKPVLAAQVRFAKTKVGPKTTVDIPDCGQTITGCQVIPKIEVRWSYVCGADRRWHAAETQIVGVCVKRECWKAIKKTFKKNVDKIINDGKDPKDLFNWKDPKSMCSLADQLQDCLKDECLITLMKMTCGVLTRDVKGAVMAALRFGQCICPTLPTISIPIYTAPCKNCSGGGGGGGGGAEEEGAGAVVAAAVSSSRASLWMAHLRLTFQCAVRATRLAAQTNTSRSSPMGKRCSRIVPARRASAPG